MRKLAICSTLAILAAGLVACGGGNAAGSLPATQPDAQPGSSSHGTTGVARFRVIVPPKSSAADVRRRAQYVSPSTTSMSIDIEQGGTPVTGFPQTVALTPSATGCTSSLATTTCVLNVTLPAGAYTATISLLDGSANVLSSGTAIPFTVVAGSTGAIDLTLSGVPRAIAFSAGSRAIHGSQAVGFTLYGSSAQPVIAIPVDADGNYIVGPGSPTFRATIVGGSGFSIAAATATSPNTLAVTPPGTNGAGAVLVVTAAYADGTCSLAGAVCTASFQVTNDIQTLFAANFSAGTVTFYAPPYTGSANTIAGFTTPSALAFDPAGHLFVADSQGNTVTEFSPPYASALFTIHTGAGSSPQGLAMNASRTLFVANRNNNTVAAYVTPYTGPGQTIASGLEGPQGLTFDAVGDLFVANSSAANVTEYQQPYSGVPTSISTGLGTQSVAVDTAGDVFAANTQANADIGTVTVSQPPYTGTPITISSGVNRPFAVTLDAANDVFVANYIGNTVTEYAPPYTGAPITISNGVDSPSALAIDGQGNLFVANASSITEYAPPYTGAPTTISTGIDGAQAILLTP